ncbi:MAG: hypothetical protein ACYTKD_15535 [Planctomycetota bacterium]|jgi:hypothetical protein
MTTERERIEKLLADGKVSAEEAERLRAALEKAEREEARAQVTPGPRNEITTPRISRLAVAGALGLPAAGVAALLVAGFAMIFTKREEQIVGAVVLVGLAVLLTGIGLSIGGLVAIRRSSGALCGTRAAAVGICAPFVAGFCALAIGVGIDAYYEAQRAAARREYDERQENLLESRRLELRREGEEELVNLWYVLTEAYEAARRNDKAALEPVVYLLDPAWALDVATGRITESDGRDSVLGSRIAPLLARSWRAREANSVKSVQFDDEIKAGTMVVTDGRDEAVVAVVKVEGKWRFSREPVQFPGRDPAGEPHEWLIMTAKPRPLESESIIPIEEPDREPAAGGGGKRGKP